MFHKAEIARQALVYSGIGVGTLFRHCSSRLKTAKQVGFPFLSVDIVKSHYAAGFEYTRWLCQTWGNYRKRNTYTRLIALGLCGHYFQKDSITSNVILILYLSVIRSILTIASMSCISSGCFIISGYPLMGPIGAALSTGLLRSYVLIPSEFQIQGL